jgi:cephalosporin hydroxylase
MTDLISGDALKNAAQKCAIALQAKIDGPQKGFFGIFDKWFARVLDRFAKFDPARAWEDAVQTEMARSPAEAGGMAWDFMRMQLFLDRWEQGRWVEFAQRESSGEHYVPRHGGEFGGDVFLTAQGAPALMHWRGIPLMKTVFDYALYPLLLAELKPRTIIEIGSGLGASAVWLADHCAMLGIETYIHSVDIQPLDLSYKGVIFHRGDCTTPEKLFPADFLTAAPHPWLVIEDAHINVEAVLNHFHNHLKQGDYMVVEDSEVKREELRRFIGAHAGAYKVDTKYTDYFGRNATCAGDSIFKRVQ